ncbi:hypothetical protein B0H11DRAFT_2274961 [Mycena galericulata]|nr:hypothetical protein B0H11DRAFT_2274961 [Mycena galericulata]
MSAPSAPQSQPFPIGAAVAGGMFVVVCAMIILVFGLVLKHRRRMPIISVEAAEGSETVRGQQKAKKFESGPHSSSRADGSTISISSSEVVSRSVE